MANHRRVLAAASLTGALLMAGGCNLGVNPRPAATLQTQTASIASATDSRLDSTTAPEPVFAAATLAPAGAGKLNPPAAKSCQEATAKTVNNGLTVCFLNIHDGDTFTLSDSTPTVHIIALAEGPAVLGINLSAGEGKTEWLQNETQVTPFRMEWDWTPSQGPKKYHMTAEAATSDKSADALVSIHVTVAGLSSQSVRATPTRRPIPTYPAYTVDPAVRQKVLDAYRQNFGVTLRSPALGRKTRTGGIDPWVSTAYVGGYLYEIDIASTGAISSYQTPIFPNLKIDFAKSISKTPVCKPAGIYSMLVVFVDFGNLGVPKEELLADLKAATDSVNASYAEFPSAGPGSPPILQVRTTGVVIPPPATLSDHHITPAQIAQIPGVQLSDYQLFTQVDLDTNHTARMAWGGLIKASNGYAISGCTEKPDQINIWTEISSIDDLTGDSNFLSAVVLTHELYHLFGYPASHNWPCTTSWSEDPMDQCGQFNIPAMILGWTDLDGDGVPEILDPIPYQ